jgi:hypothetical protein
MGSRSVDLVWVYRDLLRIVWTWPSDPDELSELNRKRGALQTLMGTIDFKRIIDEENLPPDMPTGRYQRAWRHIRSQVPGAFPGDIGHGLSVVALWTIRVQPANPISESFVPSL